MSKIGRKPINIKDVQVEVKGSTVHYKGAKVQGVHELPEGLKPEISNNELSLLCDDRTSDNKRLWGLHRALLANKISGAVKPFEQVIVITGLGFKGLLAGNKITFSLGYSHKIDFPLPAGISVEIDKTGQKLTVKGTDREQVGFVSSEIRALRPTEPYKATGIKWADEYVFRKVGKKSA